MYLLPLCVRFLFAISFADTGPNALLKTHVLLGACPIDLTFKKMGMLARFPTRVAHLHDGRDEESCSDVYLHCSLHLRLPMLASKSASSQRIISLSLRNLWLLSTPWRELASALALKTAPESLVVPVLRYIFCPLRSCFSF